MFAHRSKKRNRGAATALAVILLLLVSACGSSDTTTTAGSGVTETTVGGTETTAASTETTAGGTETTVAAMEPITFGMILVGPENDRGWSQAHFEAGQYVEEQLGATMITLDKVNTADRPDTTIESVVDSMIDQGAQMIFATSDDMKDGIEAAARAHPDVPMVWSSGDSAWQDGEAYQADLTNLGNVMGRMEYGKMIAGCAAALTSQSGSIAYLGPLINDETRRLVNSAYLGAKYCWEDVRGEAPDSLAFEVNWIGFWFNIPGFTLDPTEVTNSFLDGGADVVISGIDTTEALVRAGQRSAAGESVWAVPYDFEGACSEADEICLGVPYFNWGPSYLGLVESVEKGSFAANFQWLGPDWADMNNHDTSAIGWMPGGGLGADQAAQLDEFIAGLADGSINLYVGPLNYQDGTPFLADGEIADDPTIWYTKQLLEGVEGASSAS